MENSIRRPTLPTKEKLEKLLCLPIYSAFSSFFSLMLFFFKDLLIIATFIRQSYLRKDDSMLEWADL